MIGVRWAMRLVGLFSTIILARLLAPEDFGLVAMVMLTYGLLETISYAGVDLALLRPGHTTRDYYDTAWTVGIIQGSFLMLCLMAMAPVVAWYFNEPRALAVMLLTAPRALIESLNNIGCVAFRKDLDFAKEFRYSLYNKLLNFVVVVGAALLMRNYWALVLGALVSGTASVALSYRMHPFRPRLGLSRFREIWSFSQWLIISRIGSFLNRKCDEFVVGGVAGTTAMGNYHVANELAILPSNEIVMPIRRAMFPTLSKVASDTDEFGAAVLSSFSTVAAICLFLSFCLMVTAPEVVAIVLGAKWTDAVPLMRWMALFGGFSALLLVLELPLWVAGHTKVSAAQTWFELALIVPATLWAVHSHGAEGAAAVRAGVALLMVPLMLVLTSRWGSVPALKLLGALWRPMAAAVVMAAAVYPLVVTDALPVVAVLIVKGTACAAAYVSAMALLWLLSGRPAGLEANAIQLIGSLVKRVRRT
jgi:O-antigen/teichoic acid export membrane protein